MTPTPDVNALIERIVSIRGRVAHMSSLFHHYGYSKGQAYSVDTVDECDAAIAHLRTLQARVGELTEVVTWLAERPTIEEVMNQGLSVVSPEERIRMMGERKLEHDEMVQRARALTSQEAQRHGE